MTRRPFRLATLKRLREAERDRRRSDLADALAAEQLLCEKIDRLSHEASAWQRQVRHAGSGRLDVDQLAQANRYRWLMTAQRQQLLSQRERLQAEIERRRAALVEADRELKAVEKLEQRHQHDEQTWLLRQEQKTLDEIGNRLSPLEEAE